MLMAWSQRHLVLLPLTRTSGRQAGPHWLARKKMAGKAKPLKPMGPGTGEPWVDPRDRLSVIIRKMNEVFSGNLTEADYTGYATTLLSKLAEDPTLREQARANDTVEAFGNGAYEAKLNNAVVDALEKHSVMAEQALKYPIVFRGLANLPVDEVYLRLRAETPVAGAA